MMQTLAQASAETDSIAILAKRNDGHPAAQRRVNRIPCRISVSYFLLQDVRVSMADMLNATAQLEIHCTWLRHALASLSAAAHHAFASICWLTLKGRASSKGLMQLLCRRHVACKCHNRQTITINSLKMRLG